MARHKFCTVADEVVEVRSQRYGLIEKLAVLLWERAEPSAIAECNKAIRLASQRLVDLAAEKARSDAKGGGRRHSIPPPMKIPK